MNNLPPEYNHGPFDKEPFPIEEPIDEKLIIEEEVIEPEAD